MLRIYKRIGLALIVTLLPSLAAAAPPARDDQPTGRAVTVIKGGHVYDPTQIEAALGIAPREK